MAKNRLVYKLPSEVRLKRLKRAVLILAITTAVLTAALVFILTQYALIPLFSLGA